jgi:hypothetical protein
VLRLTMTAGGTSSYDNVVVTVREPPHAAGAEADRIQSGKKSYLDRVTRKLISTANVSVQNLGVVPMMNTELRVFVTDSTVEMPGPGWSYNPFDHYFFKAIGDLSAVQTPRDPGDTLHDQLMFRYGTTVRFTYTLEIWATYPH